MAINVTVAAVDGNAVLYFQDGSNQVIEKGTEQHFQIIDGGFCTISDDPADQEMTGEKFIEMMLEFWENLWAEIQEEAEQSPEVNPL